MRAIIRTFSPILLFVIICGGGCNSKKIDGPSISGQIDGYEDSTIYFQKRTRKGFNKLDSAKLNAEGKFQMKNPAQDLGFYFLGFNSKKRMVLITDSAEKVVVKTDSASFGRKVDMKGSVHSEHFYSYMKEIEPMRKKLDSLRKTMRSKGRRRDPKLRKAFQKTRKKLAKVSKGFVEKHPRSPAILFALSSINPKKNTDLLKSSYQNLKDSLKDSPFLANLNKKIKQIQARKQKRNRKRQMKKKQQKMLSKGKKAPEIALKTPEGSVKKLSDLRGKVVLIDFWASWCKPCMKAVPKLKKLYKKYNDDGFEIYGVSLDKKRKAWINAIEKHNMNWVHVSDLKYFNSAAAKKYKIRGIPYTVLVDKEGKIIASGLRGPELVKKVKEVMG